MEWAKDLLWLDWVLLAMLLAGAIYGLTRGFIAVLAGFVSYLLALAVAGRYTPAVVAWLDQTWGITAKVAEVLSRRIILPPEAENVPIAALKWETVMQWLANLPLPEEYKTQLAEKVQAWSEAGAHKSAAEYITGNLAAGMVSAVVFLLIAAVLGYVLAYLGRLISGFIGDVPLIGTINRILGGATGLFGIGISLAILLGLLAPLLSLRFLEGLGGALVDSKIAQWLLSTYQFVSRWLFGQEGLFFFRG